MAVLGTRGYKQYDMEDVSRLPYPYIYYKFQKCCFIYKDKNIMGKISYASVERRGGEEIASMLKRFKRKVEASGHLVELRERKEFIKPSVVKRKAKQQVIYKEKIKNLKEQSK